MTFPEVCREYFGVFCTINDFLRFLLMIMSSLVIWKSWKDVKVWGTLTGPIHRMMYFKLWETPLRLQCTLGKRGQWFPKTLLRGFSLRRRRRTRKDWRIEHYNQRWTRRNHCSHGKWRAQRKRRGLQKRLQLSAMETASRRRRLVVGPRAIWRIMNWRSRTQRAM